jgi:transcriptional regulator with XRE-family HTH domain
LRLELGLTQQDIAEQNHVSDSYISKVKNERLQFGDYPSGTFIQRLAEERKEGQTDQTVG